MADVEVRGITKKFRYVTALEDVSFDVKDGEFFVLLGPTGAGKTTMLRVISGLTKQDHGSVIFDGESVDETTPADRDTAFVFQQYSLYPTMTVYDNLAFPLRSPMRQMPELQIKQLVSETAEILRISHLLDRKTGHLSGGEMQRVSIGRAIVRHPRVFLMDEPLSNLDAKLREALRVELQHIQKTQGSTTLFVTHDQVEALTMADRIAILNEGHIVQLGTPRDIYDRPATVFVSELVGTPRINLMAAEVTNGEIQIIESEVRISLDEQSQAMPAKCLLGVRPEDVRPHDEGEFVGRVALTEPLGVETVVHIQSGKQTFLSTLSGMSTWRMGDDLRFDIVRERLHFFDEEEMRI
jgi:multiple sugar transport system ATP-binding protein